MQNQMLQKATGFLTRNRRRRTWKKVVIALACVVVFCTTYALILPAITMEKTAYCGLEPHQHSADCYEKTLICGQEESEAAVHAHSAECYAQQRKLICEQEEASTVHTHTEGCAASEQQLICENEAPEHQHTEACYETVKTYLCGLEEGETTGHLHTDECYADQEALQCGMEEGEALPGHMHTEECYESVLKCEKAEHTHALSCYSNPEADVESAEVWERTVSGVTLTGNWSEDELAIAKSQLGYQESERNYAVGQDGETKKGYTRYGAWYGDAYGDWCAMFASFCLRYAGIPETAMPREASCTRWVQKLTQAGLYQSGGYVPSEGDLVFFDVDEDGASDHVGLIAELIRDEAGEVLQFKTIEGNSDNRVQYRTYDLGEARVAGFGALPENPEANGNASVAASTEQGPEEAGKPSEVLPAAVNSETAAKEQLVLQLDVPLDVEATAGKTVRIPFVPEVTHGYVFESMMSDRRSIQCYLRDATGKTLTSQYNGEGKFKITYNLTAGTTYYFEFYTYGSGTATVPVLLSFGTEHYYINYDADAEELICGCGARKPASSSCGKNVKWSFADGVLTISGSGAMSNYSSKGAPWYPIREAIRSVVVEPGVSHIGAYAFAYEYNDVCYSLTSVTLPESVTSIGSYAFYYCKKLASSAIPSGMRSIGDYAFYYCKELTDVTIPNGVTVIGGHAFYACEKLTSITIPEGMKYIGDAVFYNCKGLTSVTIPDSVLSIGEDAFRGCESLTGVTIPEYVISLGDYAFAGCASLTSARIPERVTKISDGLFSRCKNLTSVSIPDGVTSIGENAFYYTGLTGIKIPESVTSLGNSAFSGCRGLTNILIPDSVTSIGAFAFSGAGMTSITIPKNVTSIGEYVVLNCPNLSTVYWDVQGNAKCNVAYYKRDVYREFKVVVKKNATLLSDAFTLLKDAGCRAPEFECPGYFTLSAMEANYLEAPLTNLRESRYYIDESGVFYRIDSAGKAHLAYCPPGLETYHVPGSLPAEKADAAPVPVVGVDSYACYQATLTELTFDAPEQITRLEGLAFYHARELASINGQTEEQAVLAQFPNAARGSQLFDDTKISHSSTAGAPLLYEHDNLQLTISTKPSENHQPVQDAEGAFLYYTGETAQTTITVSNPDSGQVESDSVVRVYYRFEREKSAFNYKLGTYAVQSESGNTYQLTISETSVPNCYCLELERPRQGDTISLVVSSRYPSPTSCGGFATVWGSILTKDEVEALGDALPPIQSSQTLRWDTVADTFPVKKSLYSSNSLRLLGDGKGGAVFEGLAYNISMSREGDTLEGMGKDHMTDVVFEDVLTLPEGAQFTDDVAAAIRDRTYTYTLQQPGYIFYTPEQKMILRVDVNNNYYDMSDGTLALGENGELIIRWRFKNRYTGSEISSLRFDLKMGKETVVVPQPEPGRTYTVDNRVAAEQHFTYSQNQYQQAECPVDVRAEPGFLQFSKDAPSNSKMGGSGSYTLSLYNPGVSNYERLGSLEDPLPIECYLTAAQIEALFAKDSERQLTLTIHYATLCALGENRTVTGIDGASTGTAILQNTGSNTAYHGTERTDPDCGSREKSTIVLAWTPEGQLALTVDGVQRALCAPTAGDIQAALDGVGFVITRNTQYRLAWDLTGGTGEPRILAGGETLAKSFSVRFKDSFMYLNYDANYSAYASTAYNYGYVYDTQGEQLQKGRAYTMLDEDFFLTKSWSRDGQTIDAKTELGQGSVLDYTLQVKHDGYGSYDVLPLVDHMSGAQALLAPKALNEGADWAKNCPIVTPENGGAYYLLKEPGTYSHVWTSEEQMADNVTVTRTDSGLDTVIKWYFINYNKQPSYTRTDQVKYQAMVCPGSVVPGALAYSLGNETWLSDHQSHRLYNTIPGWNGVTFRFDKKIVEAVGDTGPGTSHCGVHEGDSIVYRLTLVSNPDEDGNPVELTLHGHELYDALPFSVSSYRWSRENVSLVYGEGCNVTNGELWEVTNPGSDEQYIRWDEKFSVTFQGTAHIYVTLKFPEEIDWQEYARRYSTTTLINTFHVLNSQVSVTHDLAIAGKVRLQKGVFSSTGGAVEGRFHYSSKSNVTYYVSLYNGGQTKLYLTDMQDRLPRGFSQGDFSGQTSTETSGSWMVGAIYGADGTRAELRQAGYRCTAEKAEDGSTLLKFHFSKGSSSYYSRNILYDADRGMCYLNPGEAIIFKYSVYTNKPESTDDRALNVVSMPYYDFNGAGVTVDTGSSTIVANAESYMPNDGGCDVEDNGQAESHGFTGGTTDTQWLTSEVALTRGAIKPGITKALTSKKDSYGVVTENPVSAAPLDELTWTVVAANDGTSEMADYTLTDVMQAPYMFTGDVTYKTDTMGTKEALSLFSIYQKNQDELSISGRFVKGGDYSRENLKVNGGALHKTLYYDGQVFFDISLAFTRDADGNTAMFIRLTGDKVAIPAGGQGVLTLRTNNPTSSMENKQFLNTCFITPMSQVWDNTTNKGNMTTLKTPFAEETRPTVRNSAPVTTSYGYVTSSVKKITQTDNPANTAASTDEVNYIVLEHIGKLFDYTLSVNNDTPQAMDQLILIDGLPEPGDHTAFLQNDPRFSAFKVSLAEEPNFTVTVTDNETGGESVLDPANYKVEYSTATEFTDADWNGTSAWSSSPTGARAIRLVILDDAGTLLPKESTISLRFTCQIDGSAEPGDIAWNSFGYHYSLVNDVAELEAAPLKVGVKIPSIPQLKKQLVDHSGLPVAAEKDVTFSYLLYTGAPLANSYETEEALTQALESAGRAFQKFTLTVPKGQSASETIFLKAPNWDWENKQEYTIVELPGSEEYGFRRFDLSTARAYRFTYLCAEERVITCENMGLRWAVELTKADPTGATLSGAVFALYSPDAADRIEIPAGYQSLGIQESIQRGENTWYLSGVETTGSDGKLRWGGLLQDRYYLVEIKAPDGYYLPEGDGWLLESKRETQGVYAITVTNISGHELPESGGSGIAPYTIGGLLLILSAGSLLLYSNRKRRKEVESSS